MSQSEVFVPSGGDLHARPGPVDQGYMASMDTFRKRPSTQSGYRFGQLSQNSFFTRHNPHPGRVRHIKGLLDVPICAVNDDGYFSNPKYSLQFPPNQFNNKQLGKWKGRIPVNAINVNSQMHPINTVTGLQYFTGLNSYPYRERAVPRVGLVPVTEAWRNELAALTKSLGIEKDDVAPKKEPVQMERPKTQYSETTGRIIPPPSRAMSRGPSRQASRHGRMGQLQHIAAEPDMEAVVLSMLCQILQTEDVNAVQSWLVSAGEKEKNIVMDLIRAAVSGKDDYYQRDVANEFVMEDPNRTILPPINEAQKPTGEDNCNDLVKQYDRLILEDDGVPGEPSLTAMKMTEEVVPMPTKPPVVKETVPIDDGYKIQPPVSDAFRKQPSRPSTQAGRQGVNPPPAMGLQRQATPKLDATLRYTKSAEGKRTQNTLVCNQQVHESKNTF